MCRLLEDSNDRSDEVNLFCYRSGTVNSKTVNSKFHLIRSYCEIFFYNFPNILCLKYTVNSNFHLIRSKTLPTNDFELTVPDLYQRVVRETMVIRSFYLCEIHVNILTLPYQYITMRPFCLCEINTSTFDIFTNTQY